jgi:hypothetical protein
MTIQVLRRTLLILLAQLGDISKSAKPATGGHDPSADRASGGARQTIEAQMPTAS